MARVQAVLAGTGIIPLFGRPLLDEEMLSRFAEQLRGQKVPMLLEHDLDQPIEVTVVSAELRDGPEGDRQLLIEYDVPDSAVAAFEAVRGMSVSFTERVAGPGPDVRPDSRVWVDPVHFNAHELALVLQRLNRAGFTPEGGVYYQLSALPPPVVVFEFLNQLPDDLGWAVIAAAILEGLKVLIRRDRRARFRFMIHRDHDVVTAEIETSSERALGEAIRGLKDLDRQNGGMFVREVTAKRWRQAGTGKRSKRAKRR